MPPLMTLFAEFRGDDRKLQVDAVKAGEAAGVAAGLKASQTLGQQFKKGLPSALSAFGTGIAQGMGQQAWRGIEGAISGVANAIPDLIEKGKAWGLLVDEIADVTGATAERSSILAGSLTALGIPTANLSANFRILSTQVVTSEALFRKLGIATRDSNGVLLDTVSILDNVRGYLSGLRDGSDKAALATKLLGRSALDLIDYLNLTDAQAGALTDRLRAMGLVVGEEFRAEAEKASRETGLLDLAFTGLGVTLQAEVGPIIRRVIGSATQFIIDNMATIREVAGTVASAIAGLLGGLLGWDTSGVGTFVDSLTSLGGDGGSGVDGLRTKLAGLEGQVTKNNAVIAKGTQVTGSNTAAVDRQSAAIDRQIGVIDRREVASEKAYAKEMDRISGALQGQLDLLDAEERRLAQAERDRGLQADLLAAQEALRKARTAGPGGTIDRDAELRARQDVATAQAAIDRSERDKATAARRQTLIDTKAYIENLASLERGAENRKALAHTLANREKVLTDRLAAAQARGDTEEVAQVAAKLEAVKTTETRNNAAMRNASRRDELTQTKAQLAELKASITSAIGGGTSEAVKTAIAKNQELEAEIASLRAQLAALTTGASGNDSRHDTGGRPPLGSGGGLASAFTETAAVWKQRGEEMRQTIADIADALERIPGIVGGIQRSFDEWGAWKPPQWLQDLGSVLDWLTLHNPATQFFNTQHGLNGLGIPPPTSGKALGGIIPIGRSAWVGEAGLERAWSMPGGGTVIEPVASSARVGSRTSSPVVLQLVLPNGRVLAEFVNEQLAYLPR